MGNTNFQTIHQMGTAISNMVKQATGRDNVQNIDMEHVTVAQNHRYEEVDVSGQVVSFQAGEAGLPFEKMVVQIKPVQDLHGYDHPWPAGGGKNLFGNWEAALNGYITGTGVIGASAADRAYVFRIAPNTTYTFSATRTPLTETSEDSQIGEYYDDVAPSVGSSNGARIASGNYPASTNKIALTFTTSENAKWIVIKLCNTSKTDLEKTLATAQLETGSTATFYTPYSNICPITGWTMVNVYQSGQNMEDARVYRITFPSEAGIVYGGTLDVLTGVLTVAWYEYVFTGNEPWNASSTAHRFSTTISSYLPEAIATQKMISGAEQNVISSIFGRAIYENTDGVAYVVHQSGGALYVVNETSANTVSDIINIMKNSQLVYELATPLTYQLTPQEITTLLGTNNIWADTGDIEVKFNNVKELY